MNLFSSSKASYNGWKGEFHAQVLLYFSKLGRNSISMHDVCLSWPNGRTIQIDELIIAKSGIYVIEVKNYKGWIFGHIYNRYWTQCLNTKYIGLTEKNRLYNPIMQNQAHIICLKYILNEFPNVPYHSIVVFSNEACFKHVTYDENITHLIYMSELRKTLDSIDTDFRNTLSLIDIVKIKRTIQKNISSSDSKNHVAYVKSVQCLEKTGELHNQAKCPICGSKLVIRTAKNGEKAGTQFIGCSSFPKCRYTRSINK